MAPRQLARYGNKMIVIIKQVTRLGVNFLLDECIYFLFIMCRFDNKKLREEEKV